MKLHTTAFALACGLIWGFGVLALTWWVMLFDGSTGEPTILGMVYRGFSISPIGSLIGLIWAFFDGLVGGFIFAWLYNLLVGKMTKAPSA